MIADVLLPLNFNQSFSYSYDPSLKIEIGQFVLVPFRNKKLIGVVWNKPSKLKKKIKLKKIIQKINYPLLTKQDIVFIEKISNYNLINLGNVLDLFIYNKGFQSLDKGIKKIKDFTNFKFHKTEKVQLTDDQNQVLKKINDEINYDKFNVFLLHGIAGSGKTLVYLKIVEKLIREGHQVLILLPEKALTEQISERFRNFFNFEIAIWHSGITDKNKKKLWKGIFENKIKLVIGARSSLFLPFQNLKLIVVDEEQDASYKQDEGVCYSARDMSVMKGSTHSFPVILVSATPSIETYFNAQNKKYHYLKLSNRYQNISLPKVEIIKLSNVNLEKNNFISTEVYKSVTEFLKKGEQVLFFINRRGHSTFMMCYQCMQRLECPNCSIGLVYHQNLNKAICHYCDYSSNLDRSCKDGVKCNFKFYGYGIEKIFEEIKSKFPNYKSEIFSSDYSNNKKKEYAKQIKRIENNEINIIVGTQIISKGFNFPKLNTVVVVNADNNFFGSDIRSSEKNYQLLHQVAGRAGRFNHQSTVFFQTFSTDNKILNTMSNFEMNKFYDQELSFRKDAKLPPYYRLISFIISGPNKYQVEKFSLGLKNYLKNIPSLNILGPVSAPIPKINLKFRVRILVKFEQKMSPHRQIKNILDITKVPKDLKLQVDVDPLNFL